MLITPVVRLCISPSPVREEVLYHSDSPLSLVFFMSLAGFRLLTQDPAQLEMPIQESSLAMKAPIHAEW